ncbi:MAG: NADH:flavin oxidoreductase [Firmicutes bacterium]|nr:NADH:flavin oxidoreductase [Bacillota bacterium]MDD4336932.1 NADH:flavin oxidoreductase [Bacillota bacterium]MDD4792413.1 NADH:flavin oxidoreductase [Bacillota bacterium]
MSHLLSPLSVRNMNLKNRIVMPPMASNSGTTEGIATEATLEYYQSRAEQGVGLIIVEHTYVLESGKYRQRQLGIYSDRHVGPLSELVQRVHAAGAAIGIQVTHAGSATHSSTIGRKPLGPSAIPLSPDRELPSEIEPSSMPSLIEAFANAAKRAAAAGFDMVELHGAHGYLLNQFFSPLTNIRSDEYGGSREGRLRFPLETAKAVRSAVGPNMAVFYRLGADDGVPGGLTVNDACWAAPQLVKAGVDAIDVSGGLGGSSLPGYTGEGYFAPLSEAIKGVVDVPVLVTGGVTTPQAAELLVRQGKADLVGVGRALLADSGWATKAIQALGG